MKVSLILRVLRVVILCLAVTHNFGISSEVKIPVNVAGCVVNPHDSLKAGSAFVAGETRSIFLSAHQAVADTLLFIPYGSDSTFTIVIEHVLPEFDLAMYRSISGRCPSTCSLGSFKRMQPGDLVFYFALDPEGAMRLIQSSVYAKGQKAHMGGIVDFIDSRSQGMPGFSGSPVFNANCEVVAMISQGWRIVPLNPGDTVLNVRALSIERLRILEQRLDSTADADSLSDFRELRAKDVIDEE